MLAWEMNDKPIPPEYGAPLRLVVPFRYGARSMKAITDIQFRRRPSPLRAPGRPNRERNRWNTAFFLSEGLHRGRISGIGPSGARHRAAKPKHVELLPKLRVRASRSRDCPRRL